MATKGEALKEVIISAPRINSAAFKIRGTTPFVQLRFSQKTKNEIAEAQSNPKPASKKKRDGKDFDALYEEAMYLSDEGWRGIPASAFRAAMIAACRVANTKMTLTKMSIFVEADGYDRYEQFPLVRITKGEPHMVQHITKNFTGVIDLRTRAMWDIGWESELKINYDADQFSLTSVANLLMRAGLQVGIGEGRPYSSSADSPGMGWGQFEIVETKPM